MRIGAFLFAAALALPLPTAAQTIPGSTGWLATPAPHENPAPSPIGPLDAALIRCYREAIATGQFFMGDVNYVLGQCQGPLKAWTAACEQREGSGAAICLLGPQQAVGETLQDAWAHRHDLKGWLASLPPLPTTASGPNGPAGVGDHTPR